MDEWLEDGTGGIGARPLGCRTFGMEFDVAKRVHAVSYHDSVFRIADGIGRGFSRDSSGYRVYASATFFEGGAGDRD